VRCSDAAPACNPTSSTSRVFDRKPGDQRRSQGARQAWLHEHVQFNLSLSLQHVRMHVHARLQLNVARASCTACGCRLAALQGGGRMQPSSSCRAAAAAGSPYWLQHWPAEQMAVLGPQPPPGEAMGRLGGGGGEGGEAEGGGVGGAVGGEGGEGGEEGGGWVLGQLTLAGQSQ